MAELLIRDEDIARRVYEIAGKERLSIEEVLRRLLEQYDPPASTAKSHDTVRALRSKFYDRARKYWQETGNTDRQALTDEEMDENFWLFDGNDVPRLKSDQGTIEIAETPFMRLARLAEEANIPFDTASSDEDYDEILRTEFADYLSKRMRGDDGDDKGAGG